MHRIQPEILFRDGQLEGKEQGIVGDDGAIGCQQVTSSEAPLGIIQFGREGNQKFFQMDDIDGIQPQIDPFFKDAQQVTIAGTDRDPTGGEIATEQITIGNDGIAIRWFGATAQKIFLGGKDQPCTRRKVFLGMGWGCRQGGKEHDTNEQ